MTNPYEIPAQIREDRCSALPPQKAAEQSEFGDEIAKEERERNAEYARERAERQKKTLLLGFMMGLFSGLVVAWAFHIPNEIMLVIGIVMGVVIGMLRSELRL